MGVRSYSIPDSPKSCSPFVNSVMSSERLLETSVNFLTIIVVWASEVADIEKSKGRFCLAGFILVRV